MEASNIKAMREALNEIRSRLSYLYGHIDGTFDPPALKEVYEIAGTALSAPPRNCDVGTPEEQSKRHREWCRQARCVFGCIQCMAEWLQLPYVRELQTTGEVVK